MYKCTSEIVSMSQTRLIAHRKVFDGLNPSNNARLHTIYDSISPKERCNIHVN